MSALPLVKGFYFSDLILTWVGVYCIYNKHHEYYYIGFSLDLADRFIAHRVDLDHNRHKNKLLQKHYNELIDNDLDPLEWIDICPIYKWFVEYAFPEKIQKKLISRFANLENHLINIFSQKHKVYNVDRTAASNNLVNDLKSTLSDNTIKDFETYEINKGRLGKCVEIYNVGVYPNITQAWNALSPLTSINLSTFRNYLNEKRYTDVFGFILEKEYFAKKEKSLDEKTTNKTVSLAESKNIPKCVEVFGEVNNVYPSIASAAFAIQIDPMRLQRELSAEKSLDKYRFISREYFLNKKKEKGVDINKTVFNPNSNSAVYVQVSNYNVYSSIRDAANAAKLSEVTLGKWLKNEIFPDKFKIISFQEFLKKSDNIVEDSSRTSLSNRRAKCVEVIGTGVYDSIAQASDTTNIPQSTLRRHLSDNKHNEDYKFITLAEYQRILKSGKYDK